MNKNNKTKNRLIRITIHIAVILLIGVAVMFLWNYIIPSITGWSEINYWETLALMLLGRLLTGGLFSSWHIKRGNNRYDQHRSILSNMTKEEKREYIREHFTNNKPAE